MPRRIGLKKAQETVRAIVARHPKKKNAWNGDVCEYKRGRQRCLVGQVLADLGLPMPSLNESFRFTEVAREHFTPKAIEYLNDLQTIADVGVAPGKAIRLGDRRIPWGQIPEVAKREGVKF